MAAVMAGAMVGMKAEVPSTLDRLKALNSLTGLDTQLAEARTLCTHGARGEMAAKWLMEKIKSNSGARENAKAWDILLLAFRILTPERITTLLAPFDLFGTVQTTLDEGSNDATVMNAIRNLLVYLLDLADASNGTAVKAFLTLQSVNAASFLGSWLTGTYAVLRQPNINKKTEQSLLHPALQVWDLRNRSPHETEAFAEYCLTPASLLLTDLSFRPLVTPLRQKRRHNNSDPSHNMKTKLESLLAKYVFLSARIAFLKAQQANERSSKRLIGSQHPTFVLEKALEPLKKRCAEGKNSAHLACLPLLFDIAIRSIPAVTPKEKMAERPWMEAIWHALLACAQTSSGDIEERAVLIDMLSAVGNRMSLSKNTLDELVKDHSRLYESDRGHIDWELVAKVIEVDATVFVDSISAEHLFSGLTKSALKLGNPSFGVENGRGGSTNFRAMWKESVVIPVMIAFSRYRDLASFVKLWAEQLLCDEHNSMWSVWTQLKHPFGIIVESSATEDQTLELFNNFSEIFKLAYDTRASGEVPLAQLDASIVILDALLGSIRSETLFNKLQTEIDELLDRSLHIFELNLKTSGSYIWFAVRERQIWSMTTKCFELWFPVWAAERSTYNSLVAKGQELLTCAAVKAALKFSKAVRDDLNTSSESIQAAYDAERFVISLCDHFHLYQPLTATCAELTSIVAKHLESGELQTLLQYPELIALMKESDCDRVLTSCIKDAISPIIRTSPTSFHDLDALAATSISLRLSPLLKDIVQFASERLAPGVDGNDVLIAMLLKIPALCLSRGLREMLLDSLSLLDSTKQSLDVGQFHKRLSLMIRLMELLNPSSTLSTDPAIFWHMSNAASTIIDVRQESTTSRLSEELVTLTLDQLLGTQEQEQSLTILLAISNNVKEHINLICSNYDPLKQQQALSSVQKIIRQLEIRSKDSLKAQYPHRDPKVAKHLFVTLLNAARTEEWKYTEGKQRHLQQKETLGALLTIPTSYFKLSGVDMDMITKPLFASIRAAIERSAIESSTLDIENLISSEVQAYNLELVRSYQIACKLAPSVVDLSFAMCAGSLMDLGLLPADYTAVIQTFEQCLGIVRQSTKLDLIQEFLFIRRPVSQSSTVLAKMVIAKLDKDNGDVTDGTRTKRILSQLLLVASNTNSPTILRNLSACITTVLRAKTFLCNQHNIEETLAVLPNLARKHTTTNLAYLETCHITSTLLLHQRSCLLGRFHMVVKLFQELMSQLFGRAPFGPSVERRRLGVESARGLSRLLKLFCEPPQLRRQSQASDLIDAARQAQADVGPYMRSLLHHYCNQMLNGSLGEGMRDALLPGIWAVIDSIQIYDVDGIESLSAAMNDSERAVLREVYDGWKRFGKWRGD